MKKNIYYFSCYGVHLSHDTFLRVASTVPNHMSVGKDAALYTPVL